MHGPRRVGAAQHEGVPGGQRIEVVGDAARAARDVGEHVGEPVVARLRRRIDVLAIFRDDEADAHIHAASLAKQWEDPAQLGGARRAFRYCEPQERAEPGRLPSRTTRR